MPYLVLYLTVNTNGAICYSNEPVPPCFINMKRTNRKYSLNDLLGEKHVL